MKRKTRKKHQPAHANAVSLAAHRPRARAAAPRELRALPKNELIARLVKLQAERDPAQEGSPAEQGSPSSGAPLRAAPTIIEASVRSGQTIEFLDGDVIVIGSVGSGAEIVAGGSIHIYGTLRGRAVAGASGDLTARIFCQALDAELLCIAGRFRIADNFDAKLRGRPVQARLDGGGMALVPLTEEGKGAPGEAAPAAGIRAKRLFGLVRAAEA